MKLYLLVTMQLLTSLLNRVDSTATVFSSAPIVDDSPSTSAPNVVVFAVSSQSPTTFVSPSSTVVSTTLDGDAMVESTIVLDSNENDLSTSTSNFDPMEETIIESHANINPKVEMYNNSITGTNRMDDSLPASASQNNSTNAQNATITVSLSSSDSNGNTSNLVNDHDQNEEVITVSPTSIDENVVVFSVSSANSSIDVISVTPASTDSSKDSVVPDVTTYSPASNHSSEDTGNSSLVSLFPVSTDTSEDTAEFSVSAESKDSSGNIQIFSVSSESTDTSKNIEVFSVSSASTNLSGGINTQSTPISAGSLPVLFVLNLDNKPQDTGWKLTNSTGETIAEVPVGGYDGEPEASIVSHILELEKSTEYTFLLEAAYGEFFGKVFVYLGYNADESKMIEHYDASEEYFYRSYRFNFIPGAPGFALNNFTSETSTNSSSSTLANSSSPQIWWMGPGWMDSFNLSSGPSFEPSAHPSPLPSITPGPSLSPSISTMPSILPSDRPSFIGVPVLVILKTDSRPTDTGLTIMVGNNNDKNDNNNGNDDDDNNKNDNNDNNHIT